MTEAGLSQRLPTEDETTIASEAVAKLGKALTGEGALPLFVPEAGSEHSIELPSSIGEVLLEVLTHIARGEMVTVVPYGSVLTTQQAADILNVSRPFLTKLLEKGEIDFYKVGSHRRINAEALLEYKHKRDRTRSNALRDLQRLGQEFEAG